MNMAAAIVAIACAFFVVFIVSAIGTVTTCPRCGHLMSGHVRWLILPDRCRTCGRWCGMI